MQMLPCWARMCAPGCAGMGAFLCACKSSPACLCAWPSSTYSMAPHCGSAGCTATSLPVRVLLCPCSTACATKRTKRGRRSALLPCVSSLPQSSEVSAAAHGPPAFVPYCRAWQLTVLSLLAALLGQPLICLRQLVNLQPFLSFAPHLTTLRSGSGCGPCRPGPGAPAVWRPECAAAAVAHGTDNQPRTQVGARTAADVGREAACAMRYWPRIVLTRGRRCDSRCLPGGATACRQPITSPDACNVNHQSGPPVTLQRRLHPQRL